ncbi:hypothetical protein ACFL0V_06915, partial [Nanoarchaeota archaeon]
EVNVHKNKFVSRVESSLLNLNKESSNIRTLDREFKNIAAKLDNNFKNLSAKLDKVQNYRKGHLEIDERREDIEKKYEKKFDQLEEKLAAEKRKYATVLTEFSQEIKNAKKERERVVKLKEDVNKMIDIVKNEVERETDQLSEDEEHMLKTEQTARKILNQIEEAQVEIEKVHTEFKGSRQDLTKMEGGFLGDVKNMKQGDVEKIGAYKESKELVAKIKAFFDKSKDIETMILNAEKEDRELKKHFEAMVRKVKAFNVAAQHSAPEIKAMHEELQQIETKKKDLTSKLGKLKNLMRSLVE